MKIAFLADAHLGQTQYGLSFRARDYERALEQAVKKAIEEKCKILVLGGDMFHSMRPPVDAVSKLKSLVEDFRGSGGFVMSIDGNHDNTAGSWMKVVGSTPFGAQSGWTVPVTLTSPDSSEGYVGMWGIDGGSIQEILRELKKFHDDPSLDADILVLHLPLAEMVGFPTQVSAKDVAACLEGKRVKLVLLGDIHDGKEAVVDGIRFIYSGSPEITASNEKPEKSFLVVEYGKAGAFNVRRIPIETRKQRFVKIESEADLADFAKLAEKEAKAWANVAGGFFDIPLCHVEFDGRVLNAKERIMAIAERTGALVRCIAIHGEQKQAPQGSVDRSGFRASLAEIVDEDFADNPEAKDLLMEVLSASVEDAQEIFKKYLRKHGVKV